MFLATIENRSKRDGASRYRVKIRVAGTPTQTATFPTLAEARRWAHIREGAIRERRYFQTTEAARHTLADLIDRYRREVLPGKSPSTQINQTLHLAWWRQQLGARLLSEVTPACLSECRDLLSETRAPATVNGYLAALSHAFTTAVTEWQWLEDSPLRRVRRPREPQGRVRFLSDEERERLLKACQAGSNRYLYPIVVLALSTGARKQELLRITWPDVDLHRARILLQHTKNGERRALPLAGRALEEIQQLAPVRRLDTPLVFPRADGRRPIDIRPAWVRALREAGISDFRFHDLRHSAASYLAMTGASLAEIAEVLGHKTLSMVQRYAHLSETHISGVVARMNAAIFRL